MVQVRNRLYNVICFPLTILSTHYSPTLFLFRVTQLGRNKVGREGVGSSVLNRVKLAKRENRIVARYNLIFSYTPFNSPYDIVSRRCRGNDNHKM